MSDGSKGGHACGYAAQQSEGSPFRSAEPRTEKHDPSGSTGGNDLYTVSSMLVAREVNDPHHRPVQIPQRRMTVEPEVQPTEEIPQDESQNAAIVKLQPQMSHCLGVVQHGMIQRRNKQAQESSAQLQTHDETIQTAQIKPEGQQTAGQNHTGYKMRVDIARLIVPVGPTSQ